MQTRLNRRVPMADGVELASDVYMPDGPGPWPVVFIRTPYHRGLDDPPYPTGMQGRAHHFVAHGYACVVQDCRGKGDSDGRFEPILQETADGQASLDWIAGERWCNGRIGMWGRSYVGMVQIPAASSGHPALSCLVPSTAATSIYHEWLRRDGAFALSAALRWAIATTTTRIERADRHYAADELYGLADLDAIFNRIGFDIPKLRQWARHDSYDDYWRAADQRPLYPGVKVPALHQGGWFCDMSQGQPIAYKGLRDNAGSDAARRGQRLLMGPWWHLNTDDETADQTRFGDWEFGAQSAFPTFDYETRFLDLHLKDDDAGWAGAPPVKVFQLGANRWLDIDDWPPPEVERQAWFLDVPDGTGRLSREAPAAEGVLTFAYDPRAPMPSLGGAIHWGMMAPRGWRDQRPLFARPDVVVYRSAPLDRSLDMVGDIALELMVSTDAEDTDVIVRLCVEQASGHTAALAVGNLRCRDRDGWSSPQPMRAATPARLHLNLGAMAYRFEPGSRLVLAVTSSDFPRLYPSRNTMAAPWQPGSPVVARNAVVSGGASPSVLHLPVLPS